MNTIGIFSILLCLLMAGTSVVEVNTTRSFMTDGNVARSSMTVENTTSSSTTDENTTKSFITDENTTRSSRTNENMTTSLTNSESTTNLKSTTISVDFYSQNEKNEPYQVYEILTPISDFSTSEKKDNQLFYSSENKTENLKNKNDELISLWNGPRNKPIHENINMESTTSLPSSMSLCQKDFNACTNSDKVINLEDVKLQLFLSEVVQNLVSCAEESWCLGNEARSMLYERMMSESFFQFCDYTYCVLENTERSCFTQEEKIIILTQNLLCEANESRLSQKCLLAILQMAHVSMAQYFSDIIEESSQTICDEDSKKSGCSGSCYELGWQLHCMCVFCNHEMKMLARFEDWQWFYSMKDAMVNCSITYNDTKCMAFMPADMLYISEEFKFQDVMNYIQTFNPVVIASIIISVIILLTLIVVIIWAISKRSILCDRHNRSLYQQVKSEREFLDVDVDFITEFDDESDEHYP